MRINTLRKGSEMLRKCGYQDYLSTIDQTGALYLIIFAVSFPTLMFLHAEHR